MKILLLFSLFFSALFADSILEYNVTINLDVSGKFRVQEDILYDFDSANRHGIYRSIPRFVDVGNSKLDIRMSDFKVLHNFKEAKYTLNSSGKDVYLKIGSKDKLLQGKQVYSISYSVNNAILPSVSTKGKDMLFWNAIGNDWQVYINRARVDIFFPKELNKEKIKLLHPKKSSSFNWVNSRHLVAYSKDLPPGFGFSVMLEFMGGILEQSGQSKYEVAKNIEQKNRQIAKHLERKYTYEISQKIKKARGYNYIELAISILALILLYKFNFINFKRAKAVVVSYQPPKGLTILQSGLLLDKFTNSEDLSAAVLELALNGYVKIENSHIIKLNKSSNLLTKEQQLILDALFKNSNKFELKKEYSKEAKELEKALDSINEALYEWSANSKYSVGSFKESRAKKLFKTALLAISALAFAVVLVYFQYDYDTTNAIYIFGAPVVATSAIVAFFYRLSLEFKLVCTFALALIFAFVGAYFIKIENLSYVDFLISPLILATFVVVILIDNYIKAGKFTPKGLKVQETLLGLKEFIKKAKASEIERILKDDQEYVDKLLPYAVLFGYAEHWLKFYKSTSVIKQRTTYGDLKSLQSFNSDFLATTSMQSGISGGSGSSVSSGGSSSGGGGGGGGSW
jgi:uncharacterized membrane protein YgcG